MPNAHAPIAFAAADSGSGNWLTQLQAAMPDEQIIALGDMSIEQRKSATIAIVANPPAAAFKHLPNLNWVHSLWAGIDALVPIAQAQQFTLTRLLDPNLANTMAEAVLAWSLYLSRSMPEYQQQQTVRRWQELPYLPAAEWRVSVLGFGQLGLAASERLQANGFSVRAWSRTQNQHPSMKCYQGLDGLDQLLPETDILVCLLPLTDATRGLLNAERLAQLPPAASLINFARGPIVVAEDLLNALRGNQLRHAVLDVFDSEPLPNDSPLWEMANVTVLPHCSAPTQADSAVALAARYVAQFRANHNTPDPVDLTQGY